MLDSATKEDYRNALIQYSQAMEILELARCQRSKTLCALIESDFTLTGAVELSLKDDRFYETLKALVLEYLRREVEDVA